MMNTVPIEATPKSLIELEAEFLEYGIERMDHEVGSETYERYGLMIDMVLEEAVQLKPELAAEIDWEPLLKPTFQRLKMAEPKKGLLK